MNNSNQEYNSCVKKERENMEYPIDKKDLYANRINDNQIAHRRCYEKNPYSFGIYEGFGFRHMNFSKIVMWILVIIVLYFIITEIVRYTTLKPISLNNIKPIGGNTLTDSPEFIKKMFN